jgi:hypothetical protein
VRPSEHRSSNNNSAFGSQGGFGSQNNTNPNGNNGQPNPNGAAGTSQNQDPNASASGDASGNSNQTKDVDTSSFVGGNIIGIGSKANHKSVIVYEKATNYHQFEFIWDPSKDTMGMGGTGSGASVGRASAAPALVSRTKIRMAIRTGMRRRPTVAKTRVRSRRPTSLNSTQL